MINLKEMKRKYDQPTVKVIFLNMRYHLCDPSIGTGRVDPNGNPIYEPGNGDAPPSREFRWDEDEE